MPVATTSSSISPSGHTSPHTNGPSSPRFSDDCSISEIKERTKDYVAKYSRGASALSLIHTAKSASLRAQTLEDEGDLKTSLSSLVAAVLLLKMFLDSAELKAEGTHGVLMREFRDFQEEGGGKTLKHRVDIIEAKLKDFEKSITSAPDPVRPSADTNAKLGASVKDRLRALGNSGLDVSTTKTGRTSRDFSSRSHHPAATHQGKSNSLSSPLTPSTSWSAEFSSLHTQPPNDAANVHALVPASSFGPSSPRSSPPSSPGLPLVNMFLDDTSTRPSLLSSMSTIPNNILKESYSFTSRSDPPLTFSQVYPSMDELDSLDPLQFPIVPTSIPGIEFTTEITNSQKEFGSHAGGEPGTEAGGAFPMPPVNLGPRPSSTPITPTYNSFVSRPASPDVSDRNPRLSVRSEAMTNNRPNPETSYDGSSGSGLQFDRSDDGSFHTSGTITPRTLYATLSTNPKIKTLLLDVRTRDQFDLEHIRLKGHGLTTGIVCLEPTVLMRESLSTTSLEESLCVNPREEATLFQNRDKFDLVVVYDQNSISLEGFTSTTPSPFASTSSNTKAVASRTPLSSLVKLLMNDDRIVAKTLRSPPVFLIGGMEAWKHVIGDEGIARYGDTDGINAGLVVNGMGSIAITAGSERPAASPFPTSFPPNTTAGGSNDITSTYSGGPYEFWTPASKSETASMVTNIRDIAPRRFFGAAPSRSTASTHTGVNGNVLHTDRNVLLPNYGNAGHLLSSPSYPRSGIIEHPALPHSYRSFNGPSTTLIQYPSFPRITSSTSTATFVPGPSSASSFISPSGNYNLVSPPPQASISPTFSRRRTDYVDQSQEAISSITARPAIDYPNLPAQQLIRPPPAAASLSPERPETRPYPRPPATVKTAPPKPPTIPSDYPVTYWSDLQIGTAGLKNLGNTCYMNATIQCLSATVPFARFFTDGRWKNAVNFVNPLGSKGNLATGFANILHELWHGDISYLAPYSFRKTICNFAPQFGGHDQHDSQEFLTFLLDGLHEDLNRIIEKPRHVTTLEREAELERLPNQIASEQEWSIYRMRNDSLIVDFFQGQFRNRLQCLTCHKTSITYNSFMYLTLPVPSGKGPTKVSVKQCLDSFVKEEVIEKAEAWRCPNCKVLRAATKGLSLSRLPPVLLIHLKRFQAKGPFTDKIETFIDFPLKGLDLTNYMPPPVPPGVDKSQLNGGLPFSLEDPRSQIPPYRYDLYGVTNHYGSLSSGHYTAFIASLGGWLYCDDSSVKKTDAKEVVSRAAYVLFYKRTRP